MKTELSPSAVVVAIADYHRVSLSDAKVMYQQHIDAAVAREVQKLERTLRDEFAGRAMPFYFNSFAAANGPSRLETCELVAQWAYAMADAMIEARK